ncbi:MAG: N-6 DNA methylase [Candidatus Latescibacterota bacterium]
MNRERANTLVCQTFTQAFDKNRFLEFSRNLLNHIDESKAASWNNQYVKDAFKDHVQRYERLGTYTSPEKDKLDVLIVHLTHASKLERARTAIRNFVADHLKTRDEKDAALVAFVSPSESETTWRFSYVKMEYATVEKESGKASPEQSRRVGVETRLTPARRFSYIVGEGESCHTAQTRFLGLLRDTENDPALADIETAFSVEAVTKEFFIKYAELFEGIHNALDKLAVEDKTLRDEFTARGVNTVDFAKKLMGQIVFLYFLQRKGWLGVGKGQDWGSGPRDFLRRMANRTYAQYNNFFNDILEPVFYDTLATDRGHEAWCNSLKCRIPFLNGGLFEPLGDYDWEKTDIILPNELFTNAEFVEEGITGTGVLDVFDRYNFTVNEAEPLEKEVAIDPEMLGKVFENLIEANRRKGLGAYYTPREIVHYMCQESLINYLDTALNPAQTFEVSETSKVLVPRADIETFVHWGEQISHYEAVETEYRIKMPDSIQAHARLIDDKLAEITICDPAVGSGAFPVGMMTEIVRARSALTPYFNDIHERTPYHFKRHAIQNCLYGVDIDAGAVEIAKLRLWLSLVVDEEDVKQIKPLPNLDYRIVVGNSLLGIPFKSQKTDEIEELKEKLFNETDHAEKAELKAQVDKLLAECFAASKKSLGYEVNFDFQIFFSEVFHHKPGFDVLIANPPYVGQKGNKELFEIMKSNANFEKKMDYWYFFLHKAYEITAPNGVNTFITPNYWVTAQGGKKIRNRIANDYRIREYINFNDNAIFEAGIHTNVFILKKNRPTNNSVRCTIFTHAYKNDFLAHRDDQLNFSVDQQIILNRWTGFVHFLPDRVLKIVTKLCVDCEKLSDNETTGVSTKGVTAGKKVTDGICKINQGIITGKDKYIDKERNRSHGVFVLNEHEVSSLGLNNEERQRIKNFFKNSDIGKYSPTGRSRYYLIYVNDIENEKELRNLPTIYNHLFSYKHLLSERSINGVLESAYSRGKWWALTTDRPNIDFSGEKVLCPQRSALNTFTYSDAEWYASADVYYVSPNKPALFMNFAINDLFY